MARILAKGLNCAGSSSATVDLDKTCHSCVVIANPFRSMSSRWTRPHNVESTTYEKFASASYSRAGAIVDITIDPRAVDPDDSELLADMVLAAVNEGLRSQGLMQSKMSGL